MYPHRIRLRGPWTCEPLERDGSGSEPLPEPTQMALPCRWQDGGLKDFSGKVRFRRRFGLPRNLDSHEHLWLTFGGADRKADVWLNGHYLGGHEGDGAFEFEVTSILKERNEVIVEVESDRDGGLYGEVALEIRCPAFLRNIDLDCSGKGPLLNFHVRGEVVGTSPAPLELYLLLDEKQMARQRVTASPEGSPFRIDLEGLQVHYARHGVEKTARLYKVHLDLVCGTMTWYMHDDVFEFHAEE
ncbi:MAG: hypothetical protein KatS3mg105_0050 [Gemmatales bacterium]|nr:MAG: hypothetical protein KatS3mg105_0050 [Gemmatales bacterium]